MKLKKVFVLAVVFLALVFGQVIASEAGKTTVGGHVRLKLYDNPTGWSSWGTAFNLTRSAKAEDYVGMGFTDAILYFSQDITDNFSVEFCPTFSASTGATPKFYFDIGKQATTPALKADIDRAVIKYRAPMDIDITFGVMKPVFTMDYGHEMFWEEEYNGGKFTCNPMLGQMHDAGLEIYKNFEIGEVSLPAYLYLLNGTSYYVDNNNQPQAMIHVEPGWGPFKLSASFAAARYDNPELKGFTKWSAGFLVNWQGISLRSEFVSSKKEKSISNVRDALAEGYYITASYKPLEWLRVFYHHDSALHNFNGFFATAPGAGERYITNTAGINIFITDSSILLFQVDVADWRRRDDSAILIFTRPTLGTRITF